MNLTVELKNPPVGAELWQLVLTDWNMSIPIYALNVGLINSAEISTFEIPDGLIWPLRVVALQIVKWNLEHTAIIQLYYAQSWHPTLWDWDLNDYGDEPDPNYREIFIPALGDYYYNITTERFEAKSYTNIIDVTLPDEATAGSLVRLVVAIYNNYSTAIRLRASGTFDGETITFDTGGTAVNPGTMHLFVGSFTMPNHNVLVVVNSEYYGTDGQYHIDDTELSTVTVIEVPISGFSEFGIAAFSKV